MTNVLKLAYQYSSRHFMLNFKVDLESGSRVRFLSQANLVEFNFQFKLSIQTCTLFCLQLDFIAWLGFQYYYTFLGSQSIQRRGGL